MITKQQDSPNFHSITRFNDRVKNYSKYRPDYPDFIFLFLEAEFHLSKNMLLADIGSGTGLFSKHLLEKGYRVICVEPNKEMREYSQEHLSSYSNFTVLDTTAESTGIQKQSIDCIFVAQAFHWMNPGKTKVEFQRILKPNGVISILWILPSKSSPFFMEFELLRQNFAINSYPVIRNDENVLQQFYEPMFTRKQIFYFKTFLNFNSLKGLLQSASFIPQEEHPKYSKMIESLQSLFDKYQINGYVEMEYELPIYWNGK